MQMGIGTSIMTRRKHNFGSIGTIAVANVLESRKTVCGGYANLFCIMLDRRE